MNSTSTTNMSDICEQNSWPSGSASSAPLTISSPRPTVFTDGNVTKFRYKSGPPVVPESSESTLQTNLDQWLTDRSLPWKKTKSWKPSKRSNKFVWIKKL